MKKLCVYSHYADGRIFYVGAGSQHRPRNHSRRTQIWRDHVEKVGGEYTTTIHAWTDDRAEPKRIESELISAHNPTCNIRALDCRTYGDPKGYTFGIRLDPAVKAVLERLAEQNKRSMSSARQ